jgi:pimeloyl-ACP methyl ester carboxylesterase
MKPQVLLIHGFNVSDKGVGSVGELRGYLASEGFPYHILKYGLFRLWKTRTQNDNVAEQVAAFVKNAKAPVILIGHSNGCTISHLAVKYYGAEPLHCVFINPALAVDTKLEGPCSYDVWHSPSDRPVKWARFLPDSKWRPWGAMGAYGANLTDYNEKADIVNYNKETNFEHSSKEHSDVFKTPLLSYFGPLIVNTLKERLKLL